MPCQVQAIFFLGDIENAPIRGIVIIETVRRGGAYRKRAFFSDQDIQPRMD
ncbi:MAG: hypothetical protein HQK62_11200 [Desulfamplus sp.]|nr:hypothetical protein [Desulfamplus sp.]